MTAAADLAHRQFVIELRRQMDRTDPDALQAHLATVSSVTPLMIVLDGSTTAVAASSLSSSAALTADERVIVLSWNKEHLVLGAWGSYTSPAGILWATAAQIGAESFGAGAAAGSTGAVADGGHVHPLPALEASAAAIGVETFGAAASAGAVGAAADAGHVHAMPALDAAAGDISASSPGNALAAGSTGKAADAGHVHGREAWGTSGQIGTESFGQAAAAGSTGAVADAGHQHSLPALDATSTDIAALGAQSAGSTGKAADAGHVHPTTGLILSGAAAGGDLSGTLPSPTVAKVQGVAQTTATATLMSQLNSATVRNTSTLPATAGAGEETILTGSTAGGTLTLPGSTAQASSVNAVVNLASVNAALAAGSGTTINWNGASGSVTVAPGTAWELVLVGTVWYVMSLVNLSGGPVTLDGTSSDISAVGTALAAGSTGKAADAGHVHTALKHVIRAHLASAQTYASGTAFAALVFDTSDEDTDGGYSVSTGVYTVKTAGLWRFTAQVLFAANATGTRAIEVVTSSGALGSAIMPGLLSVMTPVQATVTERLAVNDTVTVECWQNSGRNLATGTAPGVWLHGEMSTN